MPVMSDLLFSIERHTDVQTDESHVVCIRNHAVSVSASEAAGAMQMFMQRLTEIEDLNPLEFQSAIMAVLAKGAVDDGEE